VIVDEVVAQLRSMANPRNVEGMARFGINPEKTLGIPVHALRRIAREHRRDHALALALWGTGIHEARLLAALVDDPMQVTERQMEGWVADFDSWDVCDGCCLHLFWKTPFAWRKAIEWSKRDEEFVKRAGFALMAVLAVHDKKTPDFDFAKLLRHVRRGSTDERNYVRKAVNWALRQVGKRNLALNKAAIACAREILALDTKSSRWIARDALRELEGEAVLKRLAEKAQRASSKRRSTARRA
jgi:3-methyladenine DNA glycosylase AlkD